MVALDKVDVPVGAPPKAPVTVAVIVTGCPKTCWFGGFAARAVVVVARFTIWIRAPELGK